jgi:transcriptional regulator with XRE-family HTH domain
MAIKLARTQAKKTQREVAEGAGLSAIYVSYIECGRKRPGDDALANIAAELGTTARALKRAAKRLGGEPMPTLAEPSKTTLQDPPRPPTAPKIRVAPGAKREAAEHERVAKRAEERAAKRAERIARSTREREATEERKPDRQKSARARREERRAAKRERAARRSEERSRAHAAREVARREQAERRAAERAKERAAELAEREATRSRREAEARAAKDRRREQEKAEREAARRGAEARRGTGRKRPRAAAAGDLSAGDIKSLVDEFTAQGARRIDPADLALATGIRAGHDGPASEIWSPGESGADIEPEAAGPGPSLMMDDEDLEFLRPKSRPRVGAWVEAERAQRWLSAVRPKAQRGR